MPSNSEGERRPNPWSEALIGQNDELLGRLVRDEPPEVVYIKFQEFITTSYHLISANPDQLARELSLEDRATLEKRIRKRLDAKMPFFHEFRRRLGASIRGYDLDAMRRLRRSSCLTPILGAGVSMDAGGPSWSAMVAKFLGMLLDSRRSIEIERLVPKKASPDPGNWDDYQIERSTVQIEDLTPEIRNQAQRLLAAIRNSAPVSDEILKDGAQLCLDVLGDGLFVHVAGAVHADCTPGHTHQAIAELAIPQDIVSNDGRIETRMGWDFIFTYNFDDLMGEAMGETGLPFARMASKCGQVHGDPSSPTLDEEHDLHLKIVHLHGYAPLRQFNLEGTDFVFSTSQYLNNTQRGKRNLILQTFQEQFLEEPTRSMLYVGCSFLDDTMNALLQEAHERFPGREHFAILRLPPEFRDNRMIEPIEFEKLSAKHRARGVEPVWIREFDEIPPLLRSLK